MAYKLKISSLPVILIVCVSGIVTIYLNGIEMGASVVDGVCIVRVFLGGLQQVCSLDKTERGK